MSREEGFFPSYFPQEQTGGGAESTVHHGGFAEDVSVGSDLEQSTS